jgi:hypothetical protein
MFEVSDPSTHSLDRVYYSSNQHLVNKIMGNPADYNMQGQGGGVYIDETIGVVSGNWRWIQVITDTVFNDVTCSNIDDFALINTKTIPAGIGIGGRFSSIDLASGAVIAYYA